MELTIVRHNWVSFGMDHHLDQHIQDGADEKEILQQIDPKRLAFSFSIGDDESQVHFS